MNGFFKSKFISFFIVPPPQISSEQSSFYTAIVIAFVAAIIYHIGLTVFWYSFNISEMVLYHWLGFSLLIAGMVLTKSGYPVAGLMCGSIEYVLHAALGTFFIGSASGMYFPVPLAALTWTIIPGRKKLWHHLNAVFLVIIFVLIIFFSSFIEPKYVLPASVLRWSSVAMSGSYFALVVVFIAFNSLASGWLQSLQLEREKSEHLLLNVLPEKIALRLKESEQTIADRFDSASVLFLDIVDFTRMSSSLPAKEIVSVLDDLFCVFDILVDKHGLEKIKTIGDAYMTVSGIPDPVPNHARRIVEMAIDMLVVLEKFSKVKGQAINARIGICTGPVVAGVIGKRRFLYDLWGDTVNTASRMESNGLPNKIQVTQSTYDILRDDYKFDFRGSIEIKGKGSLNTYILQHEDELARRINDGGYDFFGCGQESEVIKTANS